MIINAFNFTAVIAFPASITLIAFLTYWKTGNVITPVIGFTITSVLGSLRYPLLMLPLAVNSASGNKLLNLKINKYKFLCIILY